MLTRAQVLVVATLGTLAGNLGAGASLHCAMRREISPCTCRREDTGTGTIHVVCQRINFYEDIARALANKFTPDTKIGLDISYSQLPDFAQHSFRELGLSITRLKLNYDNLSDLKESVFAKLDLVDYFSLAYNHLTELPRHVLRQLPHVKTLDLRRNKIVTLSEEDFKDIQGVEALLVTDNLITKIEKHAFPRVLKHVHLGLNFLTSLNGALRDLDDLNWIFINANKLTTIDNELPVKAKNLTLIHAANNELETLPQDLKLIPSLQSLYFYGNKIKTLNGALQKSRNLLRIGLSFNKIERLAEDEFTEAAVLADLDIAYNELTSLNNSLRPLQALRYLNLTHNLFTEFSLQEFRGLKKLFVIDLSHNKISHITGNIDNPVDVETHVLELRLDHNHLLSLGGGFMSLQGLIRLNLSNNHLQQISPENLVGLEKLKLLDISHNQITSLEETSKTLLPSLEELIAHHNNITSLDKDFHGLPSLCFADLSYNQIHTMNYELVSKSRCHINRVPSTLKIYLQDNPVLCDERMFELVSALRVLDARISGVSTCVAVDVEQSPAPAPPRPDGEPAPSQGDSPVIVVAHMSDGMRIMPLEPERLPAPQLAYRRVGPLPVLVEPPVTLPPASNAVVEWPGEQAHPLADLRGAPQ